MQCGSNENLECNIMGLLLQNTFLATTHKHFHSKVSFELHIHICTKCLHFTLSCTYSIFKYLSLNQVNKSGTDPYMKPIKPRGHVEFRKLHMSITEGTRSEPPLPETFTPSGAMQQTRLFTCSEMVYRLSLSSHLSPTLRRSLSQKHPYTCPHLTKYPQPGPG